MIKVGGDIKEENVASVGDGGTSQSVVAKTGVASVGNVKVPNPLLLAPYHTFVEVEQPESEFVFQMQSVPTCAPFEADGGARKIKAMKRIKEYLEKELKEKIESKEVYIIG